MQNKNAVFLRTAFLFLAVCENILSAYNSLVFLSCSYEKIRRQLPAQRPSQKTN